jgi:hypothetical protein
MYLISGLERSVITEPYNDGYRHLKVLSGYVSPIFLKHIMESYPELQVEVIIGMASSDGIAIWHHQAFLDLVRDFNNRLTIFYQISRPGNHRKVYHWQQQDLILSERVFLGSANFTQNGFGRQREVLVETDFSNVADLFTDVSILSCDDSNIASNVTFYTAVPRRVTTTRVVDVTTGETQTVLATPTSRHSNSVVTSFLDSSGNVPRSSGLNWGQRDNRNPNQAYIPIRSAIHKDDETFFPPLAAPFLMYTDDEEVFQGVMAQANRKAIETPENNAIMGAYFRNRLGVPSGDPVTIEHLNNYGRHDVTIYKIDDETYYMDFSI